MQPETSRNLLLLRIAHIWTVAKQMYSRVGNNAQIYELRKIVMKLKQKGMYVFAYHSELQTLWHEPDYYQNFLVGCAAASAKCKKLVDKERVYGFLSGLNLEYNLI